MKKIIILGGKGNGTVIGSCVEDFVKGANNEWKFLGYLDDANDKGIVLDGYPVLGKINEVNKFLSDDVYFIQAIITVKKAEERLKLLNDLQIPIEKFATIIHPTAVVGKNVQFGYGVVLMPGTIISPGVKLGNHTQCYANSFVGHDTKIGNFCFIANNASVGGCIETGNGVHFGSNSSIREHVNIGDWSIIGLGSVVLKDVEPYTIVAGNPAKVIDRIKFKK